MRRARPLTRAAVAVALLEGVFSGSGTAQTLKPQDGAYHVHPGEDPQAALDAAAADPDVKLVRLHAGLYRPARRQQALLWFHAAHDGVVVEGVGEVTLTAANPDLSDPRHVGHPAVVNHVVYFGDGVGSGTVLRGVRITGANGFATDAPPDIEPGRVFRKDLFFACDGGGIKIFGRSYPTLERLVIEDNYASPCAGGVSVQHEGHTDQEVTFRDCVFRNNRTQVTGAALDLLPGSAARLVNCLFVGNVSNTGSDYVTLYNGQPFEDTIRDSGVLTIFPGCRATLQRCTFTGNRNGVDDQSGTSVYEDCLFWDNDLGGGTYATQGFDLRLKTDQGVRGCSFTGSTVTPATLLDRSGNRAGGPAPRLDHRFAPQAPEYAGKGYRPVE